MRGKDCPSLLGGTQLARRWDPVHCDVPVLRAGEGVGRWQRGGGGRGRRESREGCEGEETARAEARGINIPLRILAAHIPTHPVPRALVPTPTLFTHPGVRIISVHAGHRRPSMWTASPHRMPCLQRPVHRSLCLDARVAQHSLVGHLRRW